MATIGSVLYLAIPWRPRSLWRFSASSVPCGLLAGIKQRSALPPLRCLAPFAGISSQPNIQRLLDILQGGPSNLYYMTAAMLLTKAAQAAK